MSAKVKSPKSADGSYLSCVINALNDLGERGGSSRQSLKKLISSTKDSFSSLYFNKAIKSGIADGLIEQKKGSFKLATSKKKEIATIISTKKVSLKPLKKADSLKKIKTNGKPKITSVKLKSAKAKLKPTKNKISSVKKPKITSVKLKSVKAKLKPIKSVSLKKSKITSVKSSKKKLLKKSTKSEKKISISKSIITSVIPTTLSPKLSQIKNVKNLKLKTSPKQPIEKKKNIK